MKPPRLVAAKRPGHQSAQAWTHDSCAREHWSWLGFERCVQRVWLRRAREAAQAELTLARKSTVFHQGAPP